MIWIMTKRMFNWKSPRGKRVYTIVSQRHLFDFAKRGWHVHAGPYGSCDEASRVIEGG